MSRVMRAPNIPFGQIISTKSSAYGSVGFGGTTSSAAGNGTLRLSPIYISKPITLTRIGLQVTVIGDVGSTVRLGIYADDGTFYPGSLVLDAGTIAGDSATLQEITISQSLQKGIYWVGGAVQNVVTTQPTIRTVSSALASSIDTTASAVSNTGNNAQSMTGVTGALPSTFSTTATSTNVTPRVVWKVA